MCSAAMGAVSALLSGGDIVEAMTNAVADAIFWGGIFSFISAGVSSLRIFRSRRRARRFLIDNGLSKLEAKQVVKSFSGKIEIQITKETKVVYRYLGENSRPVSNYVTPELYSDPVNKLALAYNGNNATKTVQLSLNEGANILSGTVARVGKLTGGGIQYYVVNLEYLSLVKYI